jgi:phosphomannomutase
LEKGALNQLCKKVRSEKADLGIIFDGDGDRVFFTDEKGKEIDPDAISLILMKIFKPPYIVSTINSWRVRDYKKVIVSKIGRLFISLAMEKNKANLGTERSGHYYFKKFFYRDSGIFAAIQIINFLSGAKTRISQYIEKLPKSYHLPETNFKVKSIKSLKNKINKVRSFYKRQGGKTSEADGLSMEFCSKQGRWWFNLRFSNTESFLRLNLEAENKKLLDEKLKEIQTLLVG